MIHRQSIDEDLGAAAPWAIGATFLGGVILIGMGIPRLREQEGLETRKLENELQAQTFTERDTRLKAEVAEELAIVGQIDRVLAKPLRPPPPVPPGPSPPEPAPGTPEATPSEVREAAAARFRRASEVEAEVLQRLLIIAPPRYEARPQVRLGSVRIDAALVSEDDDIPDLLVEIRARRNLTPRDATTLSELAEKVATYESATSRRTRGWLIIVSDVPPANSKALPALLAAAGLYEDRSHLTIIGVADLTTLELPDS
jgi:hypothetical protein